MLLYLARIRCIHVNTSIFKYTKHFTFQAFIPLIKKSRGGRIGISLSDELILKWNSAKAHKAALYSYLEHLAYVSFIHESSDWML